MVTTSEVRVMPRRFCWTFRPADSCPTQDIRDFAVDLADELVACSACGCSAPRTSDVYRWGALADLSPVDRAACVLAFVQQTITYVEDATGDRHRPELVRCPIRTLLDRKGDCEDLAILAAAILWRLDVGQGSSVALVCVDGPQGHHCAVGLRGLPHGPDLARVFHRSRKQHFTYGDPTQKCSRFGQVADGYRLDRARVVVIRPRTS